MEAAVLQRGPQPVEEHLNPLPGLNGVGRLAIHPGRARPLVPPHPNPRHHQERGIADEVVQIIEPAMRIITGPSVQLGLDPPYPALRLIEGVLQLRIADLHRRTPGIPASSLPTCWSPSPCARALPGSEYYGTSAPPTALSRRRTYPPAGRLPTGPGDRERFPCSTRCRSARSAPSSTPAASPHLRRSPSMWPPHRPRSPGFGVDPARGRITHCTPAHIRQI